LGLCLAVAGSPAASISQILDFLRLPQGLLIRRFDADKHLIGVLDKVHRIQQAGIEVWCGMIVGFDTDNESVFDAQHHFLREARIPLAMVNVLVAIPRTPLYARLANEGRLDNTGELANFGTISTNVIPKRISRQALCDGYLALMRQLYEPEAYFERLDALYLRSQPVPASARTRYLRRHPWSWLKARSWSVIEVSIMIIQLMRGSRPSPTP
jgi:hypothetical protein